MAGKKKLYQNLRVLQSPKGAFNSARRLLAYVADTSSQAPPGAIAWEISNACDCYCAFCDTHELNKRYGQLTREDLLAIAHKIGRAGVGTVTISGGEPLVAKHFFAVVEVLRSYHVRVFLATNGSRLELFANRLVQAGVDTVSISLDSVVDAEHDQLRQREGLTHAIRRGIAAVRESAAAAGKNVPIRLRYVVTPKNYDRMVEFVEKWDEAVDEICFQPVQDLGDGETHHVRDKTLLFPPELEKPFRSEMERLMAAFPQYRTPYYRRMWEFLFAPDGLRNSFSCLVPALGFKVAANGDVALCTGASFITGNLVRDELEDIWNHPLFGDIRKKSRNRCRDCLCWVQPMQVNDLVPQRLLGAFAAGARG